MHLQDSHAIQLAKIYASLLAVSQTVERYEETKAPFAVSKDLSVRPILSAHSANF